MNVKQTLNGAITPTGSILKFEESTYVLTTASSLETTITIL